MLVSDSTDQSNQLCQFLHGQYSAHHFKTELKAYAAEHELLT